MNHVSFPTSLPVQGTVAFCIKCSRTEHSASECMAPENIKQEQQVSAAWYPPLTNQFDDTAQDDQVRVISVADAGGPSRPIVVTCGEKQVLPTLEAPAPDCTETLISIHLLLLAEQKQKLRHALTLAQLKEELCRNIRYTILPLLHFTREDETKVALVHKLKRFHNITIHMPQKWILSSTVMCIFHKTRANRILVKQCNVFIVSFDAQCNQKLRIVILERN